MVQDLRERAIIRQYLLGGLSPEERERVEARLMTEDGYFDALQLVKEELIDHYAEGELTGEERERFERHFLTTPGRRRSLRLAQALTDYPAPPAGDESAKKSEPARRPFAWARALFATPLHAAAYLLVAAALALGAWLALQRQSSAVGEGLLALGAAYREARPVEARVADFPYAPLANTRSGDEITFDPAARERAEVMLHSAVNREPGPASHHALGQLYLFKRQFDHAIRHLSEALKADADNPKIHSDLGAAWLERGGIELQKGEEAESSESFARSLGHLNRALELDPALPEALFNRALVRQQLKLFRLAADDWKAYLERDTTSPWAEEARQHLKSVEEQQDRSAQDREQLFQSFLAARRAADAETAWALLSRHRDFTGGFIENRLLDEHLDAATKGRAAEARERLEALSFAGALGVRRAGDHFIADLVKLYAAATGGRAAELAEARRLLKAGHEHLQQDRSGEALEFYGAAGRIFERHGAACEALFVRYPTGHARLLQGESAHSLSEFEAVRRGARANRYTWLLGQSLNALANVHIGLNNYSVALEHSRRSLEILERVGDSAGVVKVNDQLGVEHLRLGDPREALGFHRRAVERANADALGPLPRWRSYFTTAMPFHALGLSDAAIDFTKEALRLAEETKSPVNVSRSYAHLGLMYGGRGDYEAAAAHLRLAFDSGKRVQTEKVRTNALAYAALQFGNLYRRAGNFGRAIESYDEAIRLYGQLNFGAFSYVAHKGKFLSCVALRGGCPGVEQELETALRLYEQHRSKILETRNRYSFFDTEQGVYDVAIDYEFTARGDRRKAFDYSERCRARSLLDLADEGEPRRERRPAGDLRPSAPAEPAGLAEIQQQMPDEAQIVQYAVLQDKLLIWFVSRTRFEGFQQPVAAGELEGKVLNFLRLVLSRSEGDEERRRREGAELYDLLLKPVAPLLDGGKLVCIVPDKILNRLPYAALASASPDRYLVEDYTLTFSPSSTMFVRRSQTALGRLGPGAERLLSVGDPRFAHEDFPSYRYLPAAGIEAQEIAALYDSHDTLIGADATEGRVVRAMEDADVIHLATHSIVDEHSPLYSKLLLAKEARGEPGPEGSDGALLTQEIYGLRLPRTRLVVLSACRTAAERYYGGEGMIGIWSPFVTRNVPLVVASLWAVDSDSTKQLMVDFHKLRRGGGISTAAALRRAQVGMFRGPRKSYRQPYHWASFIAIGGHTQF
ncbi:MAG TPA: CHAT domain-containing protein [Pyrinomonadaceae bacterium]|nr:CHAT domain-containing protein [Pyrinomonadaceae bacterium]